MAGIQHFLVRLWKYVNEMDVSDNPVTDRRTLSLIHKTIKEVTEDIERLHYNTAIAALMELLRKINDERIVNRDCIGVLMKLLAPFAPFVTHEL